MAKYKIVKLYKFLCEEKKEFVRSKQVLRSGTSIGANIEEGIEEFLCEEKKEFVRSKQVLRSGNSIGANIEEGIEELCKILSKIKNKLSPLLIFNS